MGAGNPPSTRRISAILRVAVSPVSFQARRGPRKICRVEVSAGGGDGAGDSLFRLGLLVHLCGRQAGLLGPAQNAGQHRGDSDCRELLDWRRSRSAENDPVASSVYRTQAVGCVGPAEAPT